MKKTLTTIGLSILLIAEASASWRFSPSRIDLTQESRSSFSLITDGNLMPTDFSVSVVDRQNNEVKGVLAFPRILNQVGATQGSSEIKLRKIGKVEEEFIFLKVSSLSEHSNITFKVRILTEK